MKMIKNCIIYRYTEKFKNKWKINNDKIEKSKLKDCFEKAVGFPKPKMKALTEIARNEKISLQEERKDYYVFDVSCEFRVPKLLAAGSSPFVPVNYKIWLRKESSTIVAFDAGRKLAGVGIALLAYATTRDLSSIEYLKLNKTDFIRLKDWLLSNVPQGQIRRITLQNVEYQGMKYKQIVLSTNQLEISDLFSELLKSTQVITNMSFVTPPLSASNRPLSCRINYWGGLTIYTPNLLDSEIVEFIKIFEKLI